MTTAGLARSAADPAPSPAAPTHMDLAAGLSRWTNVRNGFTVLRIHYTADPAKQTKAWLENARAGLPPRGWRREYEIDWTAPAGEPVIPEFHAGTHVRALTIDPGGRLLRGWDFGRVAPAVVFCQLNAMGQLRVLRELMPFNVPLDLLIPMVQATTRELITHDRVFDAGDPEGESEKDLGSVTSVLRKHGIHLHCARPGTSKSYASLRERVRAQVFVPGVGLDPAIVIDPACRNLIDALAGAFALSEHPPYVPQKLHPYKDVCDALRYLHDNLGTMNVEHQRQLAQMAKNDWQW